MKRNIFAAAALLFTITGALFAQVGKDNLVVKDNLAVLPFTGGVGDEGEAIAERISFNPNLMARFGIIPRTGIASAIAQEQRFQMTGGMTDADTIADLGAQLGAKYVMAGSITALGSQKLLIVSIVRIETIQQVAGDYLTYDRIEELPAKFSDMMKTLLPLLDVDTSNLPKLAVLPVQMAGGATNQRDADTLAQILAIYLLRNKGYAIYPRTSSLETVQEEFKTQQSGVTADKNAAQSGYGVNPEYVLSVASRKLGEKNMFNASIIDLAEGIQVEGMSEQYGTLIDGITAMASIARALSGGKMSAAEIRQREKEEAARVAAENREEAAIIAAEKRDEFKRKLWFDVGAYFDVHFVNVFDQSSELEPDYYLTSTRSDGTVGTVIDSAGKKHDYASERWLYGGKLGMDLGISHFVIGVYFAIAGYEAHYIRNGDTSDNGTVSGFGYGGDFSIGYSIYSIQEIGILGRGTISTGITLLHFTENPLNVPAMFPYLRLSGRGGPFVLGLKLELPVINEKVAPRFGLDVGVGWAWANK
jgi:TolB-like protein